jgi:hypothetical protein
VVLVFSVVLVDIDVVASVGIIVLLKSFVVTADCFEFEEVASNEVGMNSSSVVVFLGVCLAVV